jgi:hypothetical protein
LVHAREHQHQDIATSRSTTTETRRCSSRKTSPPCDQGSTVSMGDGPAPERGEQHLDECGDEIDTLDREQKGIRIANFIDERGRHAA